MDPGCVFVESRPRAEVGINATGGDDGDEAGLHVGASAWGAYPTGVLLLGAGLHFTVPIPAPCLE